MTLGKGHWERLDPDLCCFCPPEKPYLVAYPGLESEEAGQNVTFCCKASGTPMPKKYSW